MREGFGKKKRQETIISPVKEFRILVRLRHETPLRTTEVSKDTILSNGGVGDGCPQVRPTKRVKSVL